MPVHSWNCDARGNKSTAFPPWWEVYQITFFGLFPHTALLQPDRTVDRKLQFFTGVGRDSDGAVQRNLPVCAYAARLNGIPSNVTRRGRESLIGALEITYCWMIVRGGRLRPEFRFLSPLKDASASETRVAIP